MGELECGVVGKSCTWTRFVNILKCVIPFNFMLKRDLNNNRYWVHAVGCACIKYLIMWIKLVA